MGLPIEWLSVIQPTPTTAKTPTCTSRTPGSRSGSAVEIPIPPSANHLWRAVSLKSRRIRLIKSRQYADWLPAAMAAMRAGLPVFPGPVRVAVTIRGGRGFSENRDLDNCLKAIGDALRHADRIGGDSVRWVVEAVIRYERRSADRPDAACVVEVFDASEEQHS